MLAIIALVQSQAVTGSVKFIDERKLKFSFI